jgi:hypothetical protein
MKLGFLRRSNLFGENAAFDLMPPLTRTRKGREEQKKNLRVTYSPAARIPKLPIKYA